MSIEALNSGEKVKIAENKHYIRCVQKLPDGRIISFREIKWDYLFSDEFKYAPKCPSCGALLLRGKI